MSRPRLGSSGLTLLEVLVSTAVLSVALGVAYGSVVAQMRRHVGQTLLAETMHAQRLAFDALVRQVDMVGFGVPIAETPRRSPMLVTIEPTRLVFWTNLQATRAFLTADARLGARELALTTTARFAAGQTIIITDGTRWSSAEFASSKGDRLVLDDALTYNFAAGALVVPIEEVTLEFAKEAVWRNGIRLFTNVQDLRFGYDAEQASNVRVVSITMTMQTRAAEPGTVDRRSVTISTRIAPPNLDL